MIKKSIITILVGIQIIKNRNIFKIIYYFNRNYRFYIYFCDQIFKISMKVLNKMESIEKKIDENSVYYRKYRCFSSSQNK
jgi:hypothetical protein